MTISSGAIFLPLVKLILVILFTSIFVNNSNANGGVGYKGVKVNLNGTSSWYNVHGVTWSYQGCGDYGGTFYNSGSSNWNGTNLGTFSTTATLQITGYAVVGWADGGDYLAGKLEYKVWKQGDAEPGSWSVINIGNYNSPTSGASQVVCSNNNDRVVGYNNGTTSIQPGVAGTYNFKVKGFGRVQYTGAGGGSFNPNDGSELTATFTIIETPIINSISASPNNGTSTNAYIGSTITISGSFFSGVNSVSMSTGGLVPSFSVNNSTTITFSLPAGYSGTITVSHPSNGTSSASASSIAQIGYISTGVGGNWSSGASWLGGSAPSLSSDLVTIASGAPITLNTNATIAALTINNGATFTASDATARTLTISQTSNATTITNNGTWSNGSGASTVIFTGNPGSTSDAVHTTSGTIAFQNVTVNKTGGTRNIGMTFGSGASISGTLEIGSGGYIASAYQGSSFWGANSTLDFNTGATYDVNPGDNTWPSGITNNPPSIEIASGVVTLKEARTATGNLTISGGTLALEAQLTIQGNWTRTSGTFTPGTQTVVLSGPNNATLSGSGGASFYNLTVNKTNQSNTITLNSPITITNVLTITNGTLPFGASTSVTAKTLTNGGIIDMTNGGTLTISSAGSLTNNATFTRGSGTVTFAGAATISGTISFNDIAISGGVDFNTASTINGTLTINLGGFVDTRPPSYASGSTLKYNSGTIYGRSAEWSSTSGAGYPHHVQISNGGSVDLGNGGTGVPRNIAGNLTIDNSCGLFMDYATNDMTQPLTVGGNILNNGILSLSESMGGGLKVGGNFTNNGTFTPHAQTTEFLGSSNQIIAGTFNGTDSTDNFYYLTISNTNGDVTLNTPINITNTLNLNTGRLILGTYNLLLGNAATVLGTPSSINMVVASGDGKIIKSFSGTGSFTFPVGDNTGTAEYSPVTVNFTSGTFNTGSVSVSLVDGVHPNITTSDKLSRYWTITSSGITSFSCTVTGTYLDSDFTGTESNLWSMRYNGSVWTYGSQVNTSNNTLTVNTSSFSDFTAGNNITLPVTFTSLSGRVTGGQAHLTWNVAQEIDVDHYEVEESVNGRQFSPLTQIDAAGRSSYQANDGQVWSGANFYRVKAVDIDGKLTYSKIIRLDNGSNDQNVQLYPNPTRGEINLALNGLSANTYRLQVVNALGQAVYQQSLTHDGGNRSLPLNLNNLPAGIYQVQLSGGTTTITRKLKIEQ